MTQHDGDRPAFWEEADPEWLERIYEATFCRERDERTGELYERAEEGLREKSPMSLSESQAIYDANPRVLEEEDDGWEGEAEDRHEAVFGRTVQAAAIGSAFANTLLDGIPQELQDIQQVFQRCEIVSRRAFADLMDDPSVSSGGEKAAALARFGVTPVMVTAACNGIGNALRHPYWSHDFSRK